MKGLLIKDGLMLVRQIKLFLLIVIVFAASGQVFLQGFALVYCAVLSITLLAYDEQSKWDRYMQMMPYRTRDIVLSKYLIGIGMSAFVALIETASATVFWLFGSRGGGELGEKLLSIGLLFACAVILMALSLPTIFRMGVEKGRIAYMSFLVAGMTVVGIFSDNLTALTRVNEAVLGFGIAAAAALVLAFSASLSVKLYRAKQYE